MSFDPIKFGSYLCESIGLNPQAVHGLTIEIDPGSYPVVTAKRIVYGKHGEAIAAAFDCYSLDPKHLPDAPETEPLPMRDDGLADVTSLADSERQLAQHAARKEAREEPHD